MISEKEREALMRLTMCAREECAMCKYEKDCNFDFQCKLATENMNILAEALRKTEPIIYGNEHNCIMTLFGDCSYNETGCGSCAVVEKVRNALDKCEPKDEPLKTTEYCNYCNHKGCEVCVANSLDEHCVPSNFEEDEDEPQAEYERVKDVVRGFMGIVDSMRNPTEEEKESVNKYLESISEPTGVNIFDMMDELQTERIK